MIATTHPQSELLARLCTGRVAAAAMLALSVAGCTDAEAPPIPKAEPGPVPPTAQRAGDPEAGYEVLVNGSYVTCRRGSACRTPRCALGRVAVGCTASSWRALVDVGFSGLTTTNSTD